MSAFDRIAIGDLHALGSHTFTAEGIKRFASAYDPQPFHLDHEAGKASIFGGLCASGWHTASVMMSLFVSTVAREAGERMSRGEPTLRFGPSPGFDDLKWLKPIYPGDTVAFSGRVAEKRPSRSRPGWGILSMEVTGTNQAGEPVFSMMSRVFVGTTD